MLKKKSSYEQRQKSSLSIFFFLFFFNLLKKQHQNLWEEQYYWPILVDNEMIASFVYEFHESDTWFILPNFKNKEHQILLKNARRNKNACHTYKVSIRLD